MDDVIVQTSERTAVSLHVSLSPPLDEEDLDNEFAMGDFGKRKS